MLSFVNTHPSFYLTIFAILLCIVDFAASAPTIGSVLHRRHLQPSDSPFPYGELADKILNVNHVSYMKREVDECEEDRVITLTDHSITLSALPASPHSSAIPKISIKNFFSIVYRIPYIIHRVVAQDVWVIAPKFLRTMQWSKKT